MDPMQFLIGTALFLLLLALCLWAVPKHRAGSNPPARGPRPTPPPPPPQASKVGIVHYSADGNRYESTEIDRAVALQRHIIKRATDGGWVPGDGEGVFEFLTRKHYEQGVADARNTPLSVAAMELAERWEDAAVSSLQSGGDTLRRCAGDLRALVRP